MLWNVEYTDEFEAWWKRLSEEEQISIDASVRLLEARGAQPQLSAQQWHSRFKAYAYA